MSPASRPVYPWAIGGGAVLELGRTTRVMGILNVTPDSFSDGGRHLDPDRAVEAGLRMAREGADILDVGGESTRPGSPEVPASEEIHRVVTVIRQLSAAGVRISIDTRKGEVAEAALEAGAVIVNDVSGLRYDPKVADIVREARAGLILMHSRGTPRDMQDDPRYHYVVQEVLTELDQACAKAEQAGVPRDSIVVDPGLGFAKTGEHNLALLRHLEELTKRGRPVLVGASRKSFLGKILGDRPVDDRKEASIAAAVAAVLMGAHIVRVHDVKGTVDAVKVADAVLAE